MCDYSLHNVSSRPAKLGDELVTTRFTNSPTRGLSEVGEPNVAVCVLPGTELAFEQEAEYEHPFARLCRRSGSASWAAELLGSGKSTQICRICITMHSSSPAA